MALFHTSVGNIICRFFLQFIHFKAYQRIVKAMNRFFDDLDDFSESSSYGDQEDTEFCFGGKANSILSSLEESIGKIDDFLSFERGFMHGDIVRSIRDPAGQMGRVIHIDMMVDLENVLGNKIKEVNSKKIQKIRSLSLGDYVVKGPWLGKVEKIEDRVTVLFDDGSKSLFTTMGSEKLIPVSPDLLEDPQYPYYPGQRVKVVLSSVSKSARWLCGRQNEIHNEGTVCAVDAGLVHVDWLCSALTGCENNLALPLVQDSENLSLLTCFSHTNWQLGDWCIYSNPEDDDQTAQILKKREFERSNGPTLQELLVIARTKTKVDVVWQDGSLSVGLDSHMLFPVSIFDAHDFWPEQFVLERGSCDDDPSIQKWGVVRSVDAKERTARVKWVSYVNQASDSFEETEETESAYELFLHPDYSYCVGDVVFKYEKGKFIDNVKHSTESSFLSCIGIVMGFNNGDVEVKWASSPTTKVKPHEISRVDKCKDSLASTPVRRDENDQDLVEEMILCNKDTPGKEEIGSLNYKGDNTEHQNTSWSSTPLFDPKAALGFISSITESLFGYLGSTSGSVASSEDGQGSESSDTLHNEEVCTLPKSAGSNIDQKVDETQTNEELVFLPGNKEADELFRQFDVVSGCSDHHFAKSSSISSSQVKGSWLKKVQREWSILERDLPETIYVRVYEERMDLLRAAIVGAPGTPYHGCLFIFDISLPCEYPQKPPMVHYNSGGLRVNPNLYESGKVCLSLLNTWAGTGSEVWNPESSTILQLLVSLQALVLNDKPYFNEAGYDEQIGKPEGEKNSVTYNENAFLVTRKSMLYILRSPPKHFEALVVAHFKKWSRDILACCRECMEERKADYDDKIEMSFSSSSSTGFKIMLAKLVPKLVEAFSPFCAEP